MSKRVRAIVRLDDSGGLCASWGTVAADGCPRLGGRHVDLHQRTPELGGLRTLLLVPATEVLLTGVNVPSRNRRQLVRAVPYALEEQLIDEVENLHFAIGARDASGFVAVAVVARERLSLWLQRCDAAGLTPDVVVPDVLAVPEPSDGWSVLLLDGVALARTGRDSGFAVEPSMFSEMLRAAEQAGEAPEHIALYQGDHVDCTDVRAAIADRGIACASKARTDPFQWLLEGAVAIGGMNLLQNGFSRRHRAPGGLRTWRASLALVALWLALQLSLSVVHLRQLAAEDHLLHERVIAIYRQAFPKARRVVDPRLQMRRHLHALRAAAGSTRSGFLVLLADAAGALAATPGCRLRSLSYRGNHLDLEFTLADLQAMERLRRALRTEKGVDARILSAGSSGDRGHARLRVSREGAP